MRDRPSESSSDCDLDLAVFDPHFVRSELDRVVEVVEARADVVAPAVPGTGEDGILEPALAERALEVEAFPLGGEELVVDVRERELLVARAHPRNRPRRDVLDPRDRDKGHLLDVTLRPVATILLVGVDLYFRGKLEGLLRDHHLVTTDSIDPPDLVIADIARIDPDEVADAYPAVPLLGFSNHTDTAGLRAAHTAGFDQVLAKSALVERAPQVVEELVEA
jgi:hypothetical protein